MFGVDEAGKHRFAAEGGVSRDCLQYTFVVLRCQERLVGGLFRVTNDIERLIEELIAPQATFV